MDGSQWIPYQPVTFPTPPFPDFVSGHSTCSAAAASNPTSWTGSDRFGYLVTIPAGSSKIETGVTPAHPVVLQWATFTDAANQAGTSRRYGGIHFRRADLAGCVLGRFAAAKAWAKAESYFDGTAKFQVHNEVLMTEDMKVHWLMNAPHISVLCGCVAAAERRYALPSLTSFSAYVISRFCDVIERRPDYKNSGNSFICNIVRATALSS